MKDTEIKKNAKEFIDYWQDKGYEKGQSQSFWLSLLQNVLGVQHPEQYISFEDQVKIDRTSFIDGYIQATHVLIEQKGKDKDLNKPIKQSDGTLLTPFQQAKRYSSELPYSQRPRWIITCNFQEFYIYDMEKPNGEPEKLLLKNLVKEYYRLQFIVNVENENIKKEMEISIKAGEIVGVLYDALLKQYDQKNEIELKSLNELCVRLVFCLYAEDSGLFGEKLAFHDYLQSFSVKDARRALIELFKVLDTKYADRDRYLDEDLAKFPYVNGGLFSNENIIIPQLTQEILDVILHKASEDFDWSEISPTIFGAVFESTLNPETRRSGGMHYTSIENIHKVIDPLFLDDLKDKLESIKHTDKNKKQLLKDYREELSKLTFLDPACGSGNFLTETYLCLRRLENEAIALEIALDKKVSAGQIVMGFGDIIKVSIGQFYGIEINDFAVTVAKTALWISESQMMKETEMIINQNLEFLPLKSYANIVEADALTTDWNSVIENHKLSYIMGNPPFVGGMFMDAKQKQTLTDVVGVNVKGVGEMDFVAGWYYKAAEYIKGTNIEVAFVSTNSICQGQQAITMWKPLFEKGIKIQFAYRTFIWESEAQQQARVHCVIVGFSLVNRKIKRIYDNERSKIVKNINSYLIDDDNFFVQSISKPICDVPAMRFGSMPRDGGGFILNEEEKNELEKREPLSKKWIRPYIGAYEFINNKIRWCLWLVNADPHELKQCPTILKRIQFIKEFRLKSVAEGTRKFANTPTLFCQIAQPSSNYIAVPKTSSEKRKYIPIGFLDKNTIASDLLFLIPNANKYHFGVLTSNVHNAWMRALCGRLKSDYRYAKDIVYNNFPWPKPTKEQKEKIEKTAQAILDARALYSSSSLSDLYDENIMPPELRKAHQANDKAVMEAYGFWGKGKKIETESECVAELMKLYKKITSSNN